LWELAQTKGWQDYFKPILQDYIDNRNRRELNSLDDCFVRSKQDAKANLAEELIIIVEKNSTDFINIKL